MSKALSKVPCNPLTDLGNGERLRDAAAGDYHWLEDERNWIHWTGNHWARIEDSAMHELAKRVARGIRDEAQSLQDEGSEKNILSWAKSSEERPRVHAMLEFGVMSWPCTRVLSIETRCGSGLPME